jgi:protein EFR3
VSALAKTLLFPFPKQSAIVERSSSYETAFRGDGISPLLKISPALMHIENASLQSLTRSTRGLGVTDLREALEGRSSMSNPALTRPPSVSTLDHASSFMGTEPTLRLTQTRSRSRSKKLSSRNADDVRDVLSRLGIGKQNAVARTKSPFPQVNINKK